MRDEFVFSKLPQDEKVRCALEKYGRSDRRNLEDNVLRLALKCPFPVDLRKGAFHLQRWLIDLGLAVHDPLGWDEASLFIKETGTSPGWPYTEHGFTQRRQLLCSSQRSLFFGECDKFLNQEKQAVWALKLKDEVLKSSKIEKQVARMFIICPSHVQMLLLKFCAKFNDFVFTKAREEVFPLWPGRSILGGSWMRLFGRMKERVVSLDGTDWDMSLHRVLFEQLYEVRAYFTRGFPTQRLVSEIVDTVILTDTGHVVQKHHGNASGSSSTLLDNSLIMLMFYMQEFFEVYPGESLEAFKKLSLSICGDDNICEYQSMWPLFRPENVIKRLNAAGIVTKFESETVGPVGANFVSKDVVDFGKYGLVPVPNTTRTLAHLLLSTPGNDALLTGVKVNSLIIECAYNEEVLPYLYAMQKAVEDEIGSNPALASKNEQVTQKTFFSSKFPLEQIRIAYTGWEASNDVHDQYKKLCEYIGNCSYQSMQRRKVPVVRMKNVPKKKKRNWVQKLDRAIENTVKGAVKTVPKFISAVPAIGKKAESAYNAAKSILNFVGVGESVMATIDLKGVQHLHTRDGSEVKGDFLSGTALSPGGVLLKYSISVGPVGSRSREMSKLYERYSITKMDLIITPSASMTSVGVLAYFVVPDIESKEIDLMSAEQVLATAPSRPAYRQINIRTAGKVSIQLPNYQYYIRNLDNVERLVSPGTLYVIAVSALSSADLPVIEQQTSYRFWGAASNPFAVGSRGMQLMGQVNLDYVSQEEMELLVAHSVDANSRLDSLWGRFKTGFVSGYTFEVASVPTQFVKKVYKITLEAGESIRLSYSSNLSTVNTAQPLLTSIVLCRTPVSSDTVNKSQLVPCYDGTWVEPMSPYIHPGDLYLFDYSYVCTEKTDLWIVPFKTATNGGLTNDITGVEQNEFSITVVVNNDENDIVGGEVVVTSMKTDCIKYTARVRNRVRMFSNSKIPPKRESIVCVEPLEEKAPQPMVLPTPLALSRRK